MTGFVADNFYSYQLINNFNMQFEKRVQRYTSLTLPYDDLKAAKGCQTNKFKQCKSYHHCISVYIYPDCIHRQVLFISNNCIALTPKVAWACI